MAKLLTRGLPGWHTKFKQTEIGEVPEEWDVAPVGHLCRVTSGGTPSRDRPEYWGGGIPWVKTGEIRYTTIYSTQESLSPAGVEASAAKVLPAGTILLAMYGQGATRGRAAILGIPAAINQACLALLPGPCVIGDYIYHLLSLMYDEVRSMGNEGTQKNLNAAMIRGIRIPVPPLHEQRAICHGITSVQERLAAEEAIARELTSLKSAVMSVLLTGELRVKPDEAAP
jgi:type I restriction enzyme S subunit